MVTARYEGRTASGSEGDIVAKAEFIEDETGQTLTDTHSRLTAVKVELSPRYGAPGNTSNQRHVFGVHEYVNSHVVPAGIALEWNYGTVDVDVNGKSFWCPWTGGNYCLRADVLGESFETSIIVLEPRVVCRMARWNGDAGTFGVAGNVEMLLTLWVEPDIVSFQDLFMEEIPVDEPGMHWGYFDDSAKGGSWSHDVSSGAGFWRMVSASGYWCVDAAGVREYVRPWSAGGKTWTIPVGWGVPGTVYGRVTPIPTQQEFYIDANGTVSVRKYGHEVSRNPTCEVYFDGQCVHEEEINE